ncbi:hypothetical protein EVAR_50498_1 [Eumeta japonica]|uniref:Uncharacterized protein n=1 Tax=Eumeta variegata TaxID=151549 RepID=A0A4C2A024_EUMVA|nr:hypothetical protein EVAR_50498_1 [Eumeta japonica]
MCPNRSKTCAEAPHLATDGQASSNSLQLVYSSVRNLSGRTRAGNFKMDRYLTEYKFRERGQREAFLRVSV